VWRFPPLDGAVVITKSIILYFLTETISLVCDLFNKNKNNFPVLCVLFDPRYIYEYGPVLKECWYRYCSSNTHYHKNLTFTMTLKEVGGILKKN
jgi:hypothetical protein